MVAKSTMLVAGLLAVGAAQAQYKSVGPDGRVTYSDVPPPPTAKVVEQKKLAGGTSAIALPFELQQATTRYPVTLYTGDKCAPCDEGRSYLRARGVPFNERTVTSDEDLALFKQQSPDGTAPVIAVGGRRSIGYAQAAWAGLLDSAGYPATAVLPSGYQNPASAPLSPNTRAPGQNLAPPAAAPAARSNAAAAPPPPPPGPPGFRF